MRAVELDRQSIEKRDFPIGRRGYDPAAVDAHLRALAAEVEELRYSLESRAGETLGSSAGTQVQGILEAAEATAADIEQKAADDARFTREQAAADAEHTRADAIARAQAHVAAVAGATVVMTERVESMDAQSAALVTALRDGAARLASDLSAVETNMSELYDAAAAGHTGEGVEESSPAASSASPAELLSGLAPAAETGTGLGAEADAPVRQGHSEFVPAAPITSQPPAAPATSEPLAVATPAPPAAPLPFPEAASSTPLSSEESSGGNGDLDGARLIALNMALNGDSRAATDRYLAEHYELADRKKLLDEVFAAVEG
jgi:DivIVA domain-containing protein